MPYINPEKVVSPRKLLDELEVLHDCGPIEGSWAAARFDYGGQPRLGLRWNGDSTSEIGVPNSRHQPTWFVVPVEFETAFEAVVEGMKRNG